MSKIELTHIDKYYGKNHVLKDLNLTIEDGDFMTLGPPAAARPPPSAWSPVWKSPRTASS